MFIPFHQTLVGATFDTDEVEFQRSNTELSMKTLPTGNQSNGDILTDFCENLDDWTIGEFSTGVLPVESSYKSRDTFLLSVTSPTTGVDSSFIYRFLAGYTDRLTSTITYAYESTSGDLNGTPCLDFRFFYSANKLLRFFISKSGIYTIAGDLLYSFPTSNNIWYQISVDIDVLSNTVDLYIGLENNMVLAVENNSSTISTGIYASDVGRQEIQAYTDSSQTILLHLDKIFTGTEFGGTFPMSTEIELESLNSGFLNTPWDFAAIADLLINPNGEAGNVLFQYEVANTLTGTYNGTWLTLTQLKAVTGETGQYLRIKVQLSGDGAQDACFSNFSIGVDIPLNPMLPPGNIMGYIGVEGSIFNPDLLEERRFDSESGRATELGFKGIVISGLQSQWLLNENNSSNVIYDNHGSRLGTSVRNTEDMFTNAGLPSGLDGGFVFNGSDKINFGGIYGLYTNTYTFVVMINTTKDTTGATMTIFEKRLGAGYGYRLNIVNNLLTTELYNGVVSNAAYATPINDGDNHFVGVKFKIEDGVWNTYLWVDGVLVDIAIHSNGSSISSGAGFNVGVRNDSVDFFEGVIANIGVFLADFNTEQINALYLGGNCTQNYTSTLPTEAIATRPITDTGNINAEHDFALIDIMENPNGETGSIFYRYAISNNPILDFETDSSEYNDTWLSEEQLRLVGKKIGRYRRIAEKHVGDGTTDAVTSEGSMATVIPSFSNEVNDLRAGVPNAAGALGTLQLTAPENIKKGVGIGANGTEIIGSYESTIVEVTNIVHSEIDINFDQEPVMEIQFGGAS